MLNAHNYLMLMMLTFHKKFRIRKGLDCQLCDTLLCHINVPVEDILNKKCRIIKRLHGEC